MENRDSPAPLSHPVLTGKLSVWSDGGSVPTLSCREPDWGFTEPIAFLPARHCRQSRLGRRCLRSPRSQHRGIGGSGDQRSGNRLRDRVDPVVRAQGRPEVRPSLASLDTYLTP